MGRIQVRNLEELRCVPTIFKFIRDNQKIDIKAINIPDSDYFDSRKKNIRGFIAFIEFNDDSSLNICRKILEQQYTVVSMEEYEKKRKQRELEKNAKAAAPRTPAKKKKKKKRKKKAR